MFTHALFACALFASTQHPSDDQADDGPPLIIREASKEGVVAAEVIAGMKTASDWKTIPGAIFTDPEVCEKQWELFLNQLAEEIAQAHELMESRKSQGKIVINVSS